MAMRHAHRRRFPWFGRRSLALAPESVLALPPAPLPVVPVEVSEPVEVLEPIEVPQPVEVDEVVEHLQPRWAEPAQQPILPAPIEGSTDVSKQHELHEVLRGFHDAVDGVHGTVLATRDGLPVASTLGDARAETVAAMAATVVALAAQAMPSDGSGDAGADSGHTVIRGSDGCLVVYATGDVGVLAVQTSSQPNIGLVHVEAPAAARELASLLA